MGSIVTNYQPKPGHADMFHAILDVLAALPSTLYVRQAQFFSATETSLLCHRENDSVPPTKSLRHCLCGAGISAAQGHRFCAARTGGWQPVGRRAVRSNSNPIALMPHILQGTLWLHLHQSLWLGQRFCPRSTREPRLALLHL